MEPPPPRSLPSLPYELITQIVLYLDSQTVLCQLTQTCKRLRDVFQPILFRTFTQNSQPVSRLVTFLRAVASRPDLAAAVTTLNFYDSLTVSDISARDILFIETCIANRGLPPPPADWHIEGTNRHIPFETLLAYTPNLETLHFPVNEEWSLDLLPVFSDVVPKIEFPRLRHLSIDYAYVAGDRWGVGYDQIAPFLEASPNLEYLSLPTVEGFWEDYGCELPALNSVQTLDLGESSSGLFFVASMIKGCGSLETFTLHWLRASGYDESHEGWSVVEVWDALYQVRGTIREITFESMVDIPLGMPTAKSVSSLSEFTHLTVLKVNGRSLEGMFQAWTLTTGSSDMDAFVGQVFPSALRSLSIWIPSYVLIPALLALARMKSRGQYGELTAVEIGTSPVFQEWLPRPEWLRNEAEMRREFARAGVQLKMEIPHIPGGMLQFALLQGGLIG
ncbi:hypothetical protein FE257_005623 [Aspergillus nanangensis]|uniref:F-box domain-containing protein n=1 Tax=Aspergillus nanangensis TaxID=2582783 RepID=A0AAD4CQD6_ASPNN|nr:hypothetical protein FE257_005623 [Aspergillus nanangensis]